MTWDDMDGTQTIGHEAARPSVGGSGGGGGWGLVLLALALGAVLAAIQC